jgi:hypothetical protein
MGTVFNHLFQGDFRDGKSARLAALPHMRYALPMDDDMEARLMARMDAMEARLMTRLNDAQERLTERLRVNEVSVSSLVEIGRTTNTLLTTIAGMLTDLGRRVTDLEKKN